ncbi:MAG: M48 family metalloprotease, partial [Parvularculaceae bacterium]|nr:M48 family metalloprotease [Parvularculaceae bacterium]
MTRRNTVSARAALALLMTASVAGCASTGGPLGVSDEQALQLGAQEHPKIVAEFGGEIKDAALKAYAEGIVKRLIAVSDNPSMQVVTTVLDSPEINAFALPGHVYITRGLLALGNSESELAGVLGHELGHIYQRHTAKRISRSNMTGLGAVLAGVGAAILTGDAQMGQQIGQIAGQTGQLFLLRFTREQEYEADQVGVKLIAKAGYDPLGEARFLNSLNRWSEIESRVSGQQRPPEFLSTHPNTAERVRRAAEEANVLGQGGEVGRDAYLTRIDGILYGDDPQTHGFIEGSGFHHPQLNFSFNVPQGMKLVNTSTAVVAQAQNIQMQFMGAASEQGPGGVIQQASKSLGVDLGQPRSITINGRPGAYGAATATTQQGQQVDVQVYAVQWQGASHWAFLWLTPSGATGQYQGAIE